MSGSVELVCLGDTARVEDLGLSLERGERVSITLERFHRSKDVLDAKLRGLLGVRIMKAQIAFPTETSANHRSISRAALSPALPSPKEVIPADLTSVVRELRELREEVMSLRVSIGAMTPPSIDWNGLESSIVRAISSALPGVSSPVPASFPATIATPTVADDVPRFIPTGIVDPTAKAEIATTKTVTSGVDESEEALRALKKRRKTD
jgi:hypothetical protein